MQPRTLATGSRHCSARPLPGLWRPCSLNSRGCFPKPDESLRLPRSVGRDRDRTPRRRLANGNENAHQGATRSGTRTQAGKRMGRWTGNSNGNANAPQAHAAPRVKATGRAIRDAFASPTRTAEQSRSCCCSCCLLMHPTAPDAFPISSSVPVPHAASSEPARGGWANARSARSAGSAGERPGWKNPVGTSGGRN